jgi:acetyl esterase/lipase
MRLTALALLVALAPAASAQDAPAINKKDVSYGPHQRNKLDITVPKSDKPLPLILWVHGGGWEAGDKSHNPANFMLKEGYAVATTNYRYSTQAIYPAQLDDCKAALRFLREHAKEYNIDPDRVGVWGASAGGHLVALLGTTGNDPEEKGKPSTQVQCVLDWFGPTDLAKLSGGAADNPIGKLLGGTTKEKAELAKSADPITHIDKADAPFLIVHGDSDKLVPLSQSEILVDALKKAGVPVELVVFKGAGHADAAFFKQVTTDEHRKKVVAFFDKYLKPKATK